MPKTIRCVNKKGRYFAWVELDAVGDAIAFVRAMSSLLGWKNILHLFPRDSNNKNKRVDAVHEKIPIQQSHNAFLILPRENKEENSFIAKWLFSPGVKVTSRTAVQLTIDSDATVMADIVAIGGHGGNGVVWVGSGAEAEVNLKDMLDHYGAKTHKSALKYLLIATCGSLDFGFGKMWLKAFNKSYPVRGILGYEGGYPANKKGRNAMWGFAKYLAKGETVLNAWRKANTDAKIEKWAALVHESALNDNMQDWIDDKLTKIETTKNVKHFGTDTYEVGGVVISTDPPPYEVFFYMGNERIDESNYDYIDYGLYPGDKGYLLIKSNRGNFVAGDTLSLLFYYWRPDKPGMNLEKLLDIDFSACHCEKEHLNANIKSKMIDGFIYKINGSEGKEFKIPYIIQKGSLRAYKQQGGTNWYGFFWISLKHSQLSAPINLKAYGAHLCALKAVVYYEDIVNDLFIEPVKKGTLYRIRPNTHLRVQFAGLQKHDTLVVKIFTLNKKQISIDSIMTISGSSDWSLSSDKMKININIYPSLPSESKIEKFEAIIKNKSNLKGEKMFGKVMYFQLQFHTPCGDKQFDIKRQLFIIS